MIDLRYHVYSLAAVFFALALGIVIGTSFVGKPADKAQMLRITNRYEKDMKVIQSDMNRQQALLRAARADIGRNEKMCLALTPLALKDKLIYHNVAIIQTGNYDDLTANLRSLIQSVGGQVNSITKVSDSFDFENPGAVGNAISAANITVQQNESGRTAILHTIADVIINAKNVDKLPILEDKNIISLSGDYTRWNRYVVIIGGSSKKDGKRVELIDVPLLDKLAGFGTTVVACEPQRSVTSYIPVWKKVDISTVDNADKPCGQIALIFAIAGEKAHYGQKRTADRLVPESLGAKID